MPAPVPYQYKSVFFCMNWTYRAFKKCKMSVNKLKCNKKLFVSCQRLLIWETLTCSWRNVATADVLPRFSRQPMEKRRVNFSFHPSSFVPQLEQSSWEAVNWKVFPSRSLRSPLFLSPYKITSRFFLLSCFLVFFIAFYSKTRLEELQGCYKPKLCDPVMSPPPFLNCYWMAVGQL